MNKGILYFSAPWCGPCQQLGPKIDELISEGVNVKKVNTDYDTSLVQKYNIRSVPTLVLTDLQGNEIKRMQGGGKTKQQLTEWYNG
jgi:thioredoxin-like negative regulator of GroEL